MPKQHHKYRGLSVAEVLQKRAAEEAAHEAERAAHEAALHVVERWNAERSPLWSPTIRCAIVAGTPWLEIYCPGCRTSRAIDIRALDRHPLASVGSPVLGLQCSFYPGSGPTPVRFAVGCEMEQTNGISARVAPSAPKSLEMLHQQIEEGFDNIAEVDDEIRGIVARNWPHLLSKLPSED
jgi:hypothetical protein